MSFNIKYNWKRKQKKNKTIYFSFNEKLQLRLTCKLFNRSILDKLPFLEKENLINMNKRYFNSLKEKYDISYRKKKNQYLFLKSNSKLFDSSEKKCFSKKQTLIKLLNNHDYMIIKNRIKLGLLDIPKKLCA